MAFRAFFVSRWEFTCDLQYSIIALASRLWPSSLIHDSSPHTGYRSSLISPTVTQKILLRVNRIWLRSCRMMLGLNSHNLYSSRLRRGRIASTTLGIYKCALSRYHNDYPMIIRASSTISSRYTLHQALTEVGIWSNVVILPNHWSS